MPSTRTWFPRSPVLRGSAVLVALACLVVTGCTADDTGSPAPPSGSGNGFPVTIEHKYGTTEITEEPKRVVTVGVTDQDPVLALGVTPVAVVNWRGTPFFPWNESRIGSSRPVELPDTSESVNIEEVAAQRPDLVLALWSNLSEQEYQQLSQIAPVVAPNGDYPAFGTPWQDTTRVTGKALGRSAQAERLVSGVEKQIADIKAQHPDLVGKTVTIAADFGDGQIYITQPSDTRYGLLTELGMKTDVPDLAGVESLSIEQVDKLNAADVVVWLVLPDATIQQNELYLSQPVHQQGRDLFPDTTTGLALTFGSVLSIPYTAERLAPQLTAAADGDPATAVQSSR